MKKEYLLFFVFLLFLLSSVNAAAFELKIRSNKNADFLLNGELIGTGKRLVIQVDDSKNNIIVARSNGFKNKENHLQAKHHFKKISFVFLSEDRVSFSYSPSKSENLPSFDRLQTGQGDSKAIIITNENYQDDETWPNLGTPIKDGEEIAKILKKDFQFKDVSHFKNVSRKQIYKIFSDAIRSSSKNDSLLIYYAGHGYYDRELIKTGYWIPIDAKGLDESTFISNEDIRKRIVTLSEKSRHVFLVSDSCFSGNLLNRALRRKTKNSKEAYYQKSAQILTSGADEYVDDRYKDSPHSPFAYFMIKYLQQSKSDFIVAGGLYSYLKSTLTNTSNQTPMFGPLKQAEHEGGDFYFFKK